MNQQTTGEKKENHSWKKDEDKMARLGWSSKFGISIFWPEIQI